MIEQSGAARGIEIGCAKSSPFQGGEKGAGPCGAGHQGVEDLSTGAGWQAWPGFQQFACDGGPRELRQCLNDGGKIVGRSGRSQQASEEGLACFPVVFGADQGGSSGDLLLLGKTAFIENFCRRIERGSQPVPERGRGLGEEIGDR